MDGATEGLASRLGSPDLAWLLADAGCIRLSVYLRLNRGSAEARVCEVLDDARGQLSRLGLGRKRRGRLVRLLTACADEAARRHRGAIGLSAFTDGDSVRVRTSPIAWNDVVSVGRHYQVLPAVPLCQTQAATLILTLSRTRARLLSVTRHYAEELLVAEPAPEPVGVNSDPQMASEARDGPEPAATAESYCRAVARSVDAELDGHPGIGVILAGDAAMTSLYRRVAGHEISAVINGNFEHAAAEQIQSVVLSRLNKLNADAIAEISARYLSLKSHAQASADENELLAAARCGRVSELLVKGDTGAAAAASQADAGSNLACISTLRYGGHVYFVPNELFPETSGNVAAIYRY